MFSSKLAISVVAVIFLTAVVLSLGAVWRSLFGATADVLWELAVTWVLVDVLAMLAAGRDGGPKAGGAGATGDHLVAASCVFVAALGAPVAAFMAPVASFVSTVACVAGFIAGAGLGNVCLVFTDGLGAATPVFVAA